MIEYTGIQNQKIRNNRNSIILLILFPVLLLAMFWTIFLFIDQKNEVQINFFTQVAPFILIGVGIWFLIAWGDRKSVV